MELRTFALQLLLPAIVCCGCATAPSRAPSKYEAEVSGSVEEIQIHRTVRTGHTRGSTPACAAASFPVMSEDVYELWSLATRASDSRIADSHIERVGSFRACIGALEAGKPLQMHTMSTVNGISYNGIGECNAPKSQPPVRTVLALNCVINLNDLPPEYSGGWIVSSSLAPYTGPNQAANAYVPGYLSTSVLIVRLWKKPK